jgi:aminodeoxyfutalosine deaminase
VLTTGALRTEQDFRQVVVDYAAEAASHGALYLEGIFSPAEPASRGTARGEVFAVFGTDLSADYRAASSLGVSPETMYRAGVDGALCDEETRAAPRHAGEAFDWAAIAPGDPVT